MELSTQCPRCGTVFPATLEQLQLRKGYIRCVNCAHIFDGYEAVVAGEQARDAAAGSAPDPAVAPVSPPQAAPVQVPNDPPSEPARSWSTMRPAVASAAAPKPAAAEPDEAQAAAMPQVLRQRPAARASAAPQEPAADSRFRMTADAEGDDGPRFTLSSAHLPPRQRSEPSLGVDADEPETDPDMLVPDDAGQHADEWDEAAEARPAVYADPERGHTERPSVYIEPRRDEAEESLPEFLETRDRRWRGVLRVFWGGLSLLALLALLGQLAYIYRGQIADHSPELRPLLQQVCASLKCDVPYARRILLISITNSSLRALPESGAPAGAKNANGGKDSSRMLLQLTLRNNDARAQEWPTLTLDLVDFSGSVVSKKNLAPNEYLPSGLRGSPFAPHSEVALAVPLTVTGYHVNGYQLGKFFP
ncbi:DUF3426 domain-containing protein [Candidimonas humi]|uniref:DUF3426 domain-containing protein n=1 Tax=Candidimonas humi TaxID=683355 RepID=A0ABV8P3C7_9BURK|nr:zinc-ribbon and DUF3426 domain-containing protein [Candidimonas humi]MBV6305370.1 DUF3426 domain-containing protein [Candidimonas humi]